MRSPFNSLIGLSDLLIEDLNLLSPQEIRKMLLSIHQPLIRTLSFLDDLLLCSKSQAGKLPFKPERLTFSDVCEETVSLLQVQASAKKIDIRRHDPGQMTVFADRNMLKTLLRNLVSNAVKFTNPNGLITVSAQKGADSVLITVSDNGIGIDETGLISLWDDTRVHTTGGTAGESGTGLGLSLCKDFVEKHGGLIWVESELGKGSSFKFRLPDSVINNNKSA